MGSAIALGNFDGVHKAHEALIRRMADRARREGLSSCAYVFTPHPRIQLCPSEAPNLLMTDSLKTRRLLEIGIDKVEGETRGMEILSLAPDRFVKQVLVEELDTKYVIAGFNYRFGKDASGDAELLKHLCQKYAITCEIMDSITYGGAPVSSTRIRKLLAEGKIEEVNALSFAPYTLTGRIQEGKKLGREIGFPTINIEIPRTLLVPRKGVYASRVRIGKDVYESVTNIGENPTVEHAVPRAESHLFDFSEEAYGQTAEITLLHFLRPEQQFSDVKALCAQIRRDIEKTRLYFERKDLHAADID